MLMDEFPVRQTLANDCNKHLLKDFFCLKVTTEMQL